MTSEGAGGAFATLTHAKLRAAQGDVPGAARILRVILAAQPDHREASEMLASLEHRVTVTYREPAEPAVEHRQPATTGELSNRFREAVAGRRPPTRIARLELWMETVRRNRGERRVR